MINKAKVEGKIYDVLEFDEMVKRQANKTIPQYSAIIEDGIIYPVRNKFDTKPGVYYSTFMTEFKHPTEEEMIEYRVSEENYINFSAIENLSDFIREQDKLKVAERSILTSPEHIFKIRIGPDDNPVMKGLKTAINLKQIDLEKYEQRFGPNFNNDKRLLTKPSITLSKLQSLLPALDMKGTLIIEDSDDNVANPIGQQVIIPLSMYLEEEEV